MTKYIFDLGFDWDSLPKGGFDGFLAWGFLNSETLGSETSLAKLKAGDSFIINLWNISDVPDPGVTAALPSDWMSFGAGDVRTQSEGKSSPTTQSLSGAVLQPFGTGNSAIFGDDLPGWNVVLNRAALEVVLANTGRFFFTFKVDVTQGGVTKHYGVDPEMIINP